VHEKERDVRDIQIISQGRAREVGEVWLVAKDLRKKDARVRVKRVSPQPASRYHVIKEIFSRGNP